MDSFMSLAKQGYDAYEKSQSPPSRTEDNEERVTKTGGHEFNDPHHRSGGSNPPWFNEDEVVKKASSEGSGDSSMFSSALAHINSSPDKHEEPIDEEEVTEAHRKVYSERSTSGMSASSMGSAAALEVMKKFTGGGKQDSKKPNSSTDLLSLAMAEASKLFDKSGGSSSGNKQDAVNSAGMTIMKMMLKSKFGGTTGGKDSGGLGGLMSMAGKFM
jgi:hypothetical protein